MAPVHATDLALVPEGLQALKKGTKEVGVDRRGAARHRQGIFHAGLIPNIPEHPRHRQHTQRGRKRFFNDAIHAWRMRVEWPFAWDEKGKRRLLRFARIQQQPYGMKVLAYTLINLRKFGGTSNLQPVTCYSLMPT